MNRPCSTEDETFPFDLATKPKTHFGSKKPHMVEKQRQLVQEKRSTTKFRSSSNGIGATSIFEVSRTQSHRNVTLLARRHNISAITTTEPNRLHSPSPTEEVENIFN